MASGRDEGGDHEGDVAGAEHIGPEGGRHSEPRGAERGHRPIRTGPGATVRIDDLGRGEAGDHAVEHGQTPRAQVLRVERRHDGGDPQDTHPDLGPLGVVRNAVALAERREVGLLLGEQILDGRARRVGLDGGGRLASRPRAPGTQPARCPVPWHRPARRQAS